MSEMKWGLVVDFLYSEARRIYAELKRGKYEDPTQAAAMFGSAEVLGVVAKALHTGLGTLGALEPLLKRAEQSPELRQALLELEKNTRELEKLRPADQFAADLEPGDKRH